MKEIHMLRNRQTLHAWMLACALGVLAAPPVRAGQPVTLTHVHGLSYSADGKQLLIPSHHGLAVYADGRWSKAEGPAHDYMGLSATRDALYSSGHPAPGSELTDPFGLIKSSDGGKTWQQLGLTGESDFHVLATSFATNTVYVANKEANTRMSQVGIYHTRTDGLRWRRAAAKGLGRWLHSLAVHPTNAAVVAAGTDEGLYLSRNSAESFERLVGGMVTAESFDSGWAALVVQYLCRQGGAGEDRIEGQGQGRRGADPRADRRCCGVHRAEPCSARRDRDRDLQAKRVSQQGPGSDLDADREGRNDP